MNNFAFFGTILLSSIVLASTFDSYNVDHGQPACMTENELNVGVFQNFWDPTAFWACYELNAPGQLMRCQPGTAFQKSLKKCVSWSEWVWEAPDGSLNADSTAQFPMEEQHDFIEETDRYPETDFDPLTENDTQLDYNLFSSSTDEDSLIEKENSIEEVELNHSNEINFDETQLDYNLSSSSTDEKENSLEEDEQNHSNEINFGESHNVNLSFFPEPELTHEENDEEENQRPTNEISLATDEKKNLATSIFEKA